MATSGPGAIHLLNGLYDAKLDHAPVVAIVGQQKRAALGGDYQQEVDLVSLFKDVAGEYVHMCTAPEQMRHLIDRAMRIAMAERTVTCTIVPNDVQELDAVETPPRAHGTIHSGPGYAPPRIVPAEEDLRRAAEVLNAGSGSPCWSGPARCTPPTRSSRSPRSWAPASPRRCSVAPRCPTICRSSPARSGSWARGRAGT
jgi:pyruvate dehydrogenase (quinone)